MSASKYWKTISTPIGKIVISSNCDAIDGVLLTGAAEFLKQAGAEEKSNPLLTEAARQMSGYFRGELKSFSLPLTLAGTPFQRKIWRALQEIRYGETQSYAALAERAGYPNAFRAVGNANGKNPIPIIVPCHRVIAKDGTIGGYGGGLPTKKILLALEGAWEA